MSDDILLELKGVTGGSERTSFKGQIQLESWGFGVQNSADLHSGGSAHTPSKPSVNDIEVTKWFDKASPALLTAACSRTHYDQAIIRVFTGDLPTTVLTLTGGVVVVSYDLHNHMGPRMSETFRLHFGAFELSFQPVNAKGEKDGGAIVAKYAMATAKGGK